MTESKAVVTCAMNSGAMNCKGHQESFGSDGFKGVHTTNMH